VLVNKCIIVVLYFMMLTLVMSIIVVVSDPKLEWTDSQSMELSQLTFASEFPPHVIEHTGYVLYHSFTKQELKLMFNK